MPQIIQTSLTVPVGFDSEVFDVSETSKQYKIGISTINKSALLKPRSAMRADAFPVAASIWHLPEQETEAKCLLVAFCRDRIKEARQVAAEIVATADAGDSLLNSLDV